MTKTIYEVHPVAPERKAELRAHGYKILDARFDPNPKPAEPQKRSRKTEPSEA